MDRKEKIRILKKLEYYVKKSEKLVNGLIKHGYAIESDPIEQIQDLCNAFMWVVSESVGDKHKWISWYIYDNEFGQKGFEAGFNGKLKCIRTFDELLDLIEEQP